MKAAFFTHFGAPEIVVSIQDIEKPIPKEDEVLVRIHATAINDYDWSLVRGKPYLYRLMFGLTKPKLRLGMEVAGVLEHVGKNVTEFQVGDEVYGDTSEAKFGTMAEYIAVNPKVLRHKPKEISFEEAACVPHAALLALQGLREAGQLSPETKVLINGAGGGVGNFAIQLLKKQGCRVTGVDSAPKFDHMKELGYDALIDYKSQDFTQQDEKYDVILDCKSLRSPFAYLRALKSSGKYITVGGNPDKLISLLFWGLLTRPFTKKRLQILALKTNQGLDEISEMFAQGQLKVSIDGPYALEEVPRLIQYFGEGKHQGKVVVRP